MNKRESVKAFDSFTVIASEPHGITAKQLSIILKCSKNAIYQHLKRLRASGKIERMAYGLWKTVPEKLSSNPMGESPNPPMSLHDIWFSIRLPVTVQWKKRRTYFDSVSLAYESLKWKSQAEAFDFMGTRIWLTDRKLVVIVSKAFFGRSWDEVSLYALKELKRVLLALQSVLKVPLPKALDLAWTDRKHYAKVNDLLARDYRKCDKKLSVPLSKGKLVIDWSDHVDHLELQNGQALFMDKGIVGFFQSVERYPDFTVDLQMAINQKFKERTEELYKRIQIIQLWIDGHATGKF